MSVVEAETAGDALLRASRRVDWRFLLPDPELGQVVCLGRCDEDLVDSLRLFSRSVAILGAGAPSGAAAYDCAVLQSPRGEDLATLSSVLRPGGYAYLEVARGGAASARACARALERSGFEDVRTHWHWPSFRSCAEIAPLDEPAAIRLALSRRRSGLDSRLKALAGRALLAAGALPHVVPCSSVVARCPEEPGDRA